MALRGFGVPIGRPLSSLETKRCVLSIKVLRGHTCLSRNLFAKGYQVGAETFPSGVCLVALANNVNLFETKTGQGSCSGFSTTLKRSSNRASAASAESRSAIVLGFCKAKINNQLASAAEEALAERHNARMASKWQKTGKNGYARINSPSAKSQLSTSSSPE